MDAKNLDGTKLLDVWARMPLAEASLLTWRFVFDEQRLNAWWEQYRGRCYEKMISFATMTHLVADALLQYGGSGRRSFEKNIEAGQLDSSVQGAFGKLGRIPLEVSQAVLREGTAAMRELFPRRAVRSLPASLSTFDVIVLDGKTIKGVTKRLKPLRGVGGGLLGGKALVALEWTTGLALAMQAHADGDASEKRLVKELVPQTDRQLLKPRLFLADRGFCDLVQPLYFTARPGDHFLVRHHSGTTFTPDPATARSGIDREGRKYTETWGWLGSKANKNRRYVRKIHLFRPKEDEDLILITDLLDAAEFPADDLLWLYRERWGIERMFQKVTEVFGLERLIGGTPQACVFQFAFCMILYNIVQLLTTYVAQAQKCEAEKISQEKLFDDVHRQLIAWNVVFTPEQTIDQFSSCPSPRELQRRLRELLADTWSDTWWKAKPRPNRRPTPRQAKRGHGSVYRILKADATSARKPPQRC
jgi:DDE family transposase